MLGAMRFQFLNQQHEVRTPSDWNNPDWPRLWIYNLHYFDDLDATDRLARSEWHEAWIGRWIADNPPPSGAGWEPYCLSLRIVNWCRFAWRGGRLSDLAIHSLAVQARALADQLEFHLLGNHLFENAKALVFAGLFFEGSEANTWLQTGLRYLVRELDEQILEDGGHFERSPMYHNIILTDILELIEALRLFPGRAPLSVTEKLRQTASLMLDWAGAMAHDDGGPSFFNDSALGIAPDIPALQSMAGTLDIHSSGIEGRPVVIDLAASGYFRARCGPALLIADVGEVGPDYLPGHAHADTLSCELSLGGHRLLVNTGTSTYDIGTDRLSQRGTAAHNTVVVDGENSSEVWSSFRVARRARVTERGMDQVDRQAIFWGAHDGYRRLGGRLVHSRRWTLTSGDLLVEDELSGTRRTAAAYWRFHPDVTLHCMSPVAFEGQAGRHTFRIEIAGGEGSIMGGRWAPRFGETKENIALLIAFTDQKLRTRFLW